MGREVEEQMRQINIIGAGTQIKGDIVCSSDIRIDGKVEGNLQVQGKIVVGTLGNIKGEITCKNSEIEGKVEGKLHVSDLLMLKKTSTVVGDINIGKLAIEPGAVFSGNCKMEVKGAAEAAPSK